MTKRAFAFVSVLLCAVLLFSTAALATETTTYELDALGMSIDIPDNYGIFTRDIPKDDPAYAQFGFTKEQVDGWLTEGNMYLNAIRPDGAHEIIVTMIDSPLEDFAQLSDTTLSTLASTWVDVAESAGITYIKFEIYQHGQVKFVKIYNSQPYNNQTVYGLQYYTVCNNQAINITMQSYVGEITEENEKELKKIVDSADFRGAKPISEVGIETEPFEYKDAEADLSFTVPANWVQRDLLKDRETLDAKFASAQESGLIILYGSVDLWEMIPKEEQMGQSREEVNSNMFSDEEMKDFAKDFGIEGMEVSKVEYGGKPYFMFEGVLDSQVGGTTISIPAAILLRIENGYLFQFQFMGERNNPYFKDFEQLLDSVRYPMVATEYGTDFVRVPSTPTHVFPSASFGIWITATIIISLIVTVIVYSLPIIIYRYTVLKRPVERKKAKRITIIYGVIAFIVMSMIHVLINGSGAAGGAIFLWSWVNYRVLTGGKKRDIAPAPQGVALSEPLQEELPTVDTIQKVTSLDGLDSVGADELIGKIKAQGMDAIDIVKKSDLDKEEKAEQPMIAFCHKCGSKLAPGSAVCGYCGTRIPRESEGEKE